MQAEPMLMNQSTARPGGTYILVTLNPTMPMTIAAGRGV
jgi:hypothetical protein